MLKTAVARTALPKVIERRVKSATRQAESVLRRKQEKAKHLERKNAMRHLVDFNRMYKKKKQKSRADEMEERWLGPLAPKRYVSEKEKAMKNSITMDEFHALPIAKHQRIKHWNIVPKDRVVILNGPDKHKIGTVMSIDKKTNTLIVEGMNTVNVQVPEYMRETQKDGKAPYTYSREKPIHIDDVRLVYPLPDPETGAVKDTIIAALETTSVYVDRDTGNRGWKRKIVGEDIIIPWPKGEPKEWKEHPGDTRMIDVEFRSYIPTLLKEPFPLEVIDELRNKYSKFRTRHDPEYIERKLAEEKAEAERNKPIRTPLQELNRKIRLEKKARGPPVLTKEMLERIGRVMALNKPESLQKILSTPSAPTPEITQAPAAV